MLRKVLLISCASLLLIGSFFIGIHVGVNQYVLLMSSGSAFSTSRDLAIIRSGRADSLICEKEARLDTELKLYQEFTKSGQRFLLWPYLHSVDSGAYIVKVNEYRANYPESEKPCR